MGEGLGIGGHQKVRGTRTDTWLTPRAIIDALGPFDLDPCAAPDPKPWQTAHTHYTWPAQDGLILPWFGRVWLNPPYGRALGTWLQRLARHGRGTAFTFARTETKAFHDHVWNEADAILMLRGRVSFCYPDGRPGRNGGAPSVAIAYGREDVERLLDSGIPGKLLALKRPVMIHLALNVDPPMPAWRQVVTDAIRALGGRTSLSALYEALEEHPKAKANGRNWQAKVRQTAGVVAKRVDVGQYALGI
jgi:hypothetical protein